jgi:hypothetical protein
MHQKVKKTRIVIKVENFDKNKTFFINPKNQKSPFKHFRFDMSKSPMKRLRSLPL